MYCNHIVGNVGSSSARRVADQMHRSTQQMNDAILHATRQMGDEISQATHLINGEISRATKDVTSSINSAAITLQFRLETVAGSLSSALEANISSLEERILVGALIIGGSIILFALVHWYSRRPETQIVYIQSTIEIEEADGKKTKAHVVVQGPAKVVREHLQGVGTQLRELVDDSVGVRVRTQQRHMLQTSEVGVRVPSLVTGLPVPSL